MTQAFTPAEIAGIRTPFPPSGVLIANGGNLVSVICGDRALFICRLPEPRPLRTIDLNGRRADASALSADGCLIVVGDHAGMFTTWNTQTGETWFDLRLPPYGGAAAFSRNGRLLALAAMGQPVQVFDVPARRRLFALESVTGGVNAIAFSRDGSSLATADGDTVVRIYDARTGRLMFRNDDFLLEALAVEFSADGKQVIAAGADKTIAFIDKASGRTVRSMDRTVEPAFNLALSPDGTSLAATYMKSDNLLEPAPVIVWDVATGQRRAEWLPPGVALGGGWTGDGHLLIATGDKTGLRIWRIL